MKAWRARGVSRRDVDVADLEALRAFLKRERWRVLVNATALASLEACEDDPALARRVNAEAVAVMAEEAARRGARLLHFSTDYVFDGRLYRAYREDDEPRPLSVYGRTKLEGEQAVLAASSNHVVARVSWLFGPGKPSFPHQILLRALRGEPLEAVEDKTSCPTYSADAAAWLAPWLEEELPGGVLHVCNAGACSWLDYARGVLDVADSLGWPLQTRDIRPIPMADVAAFRAPRPPHTPMDGSKLERLLRRPRRLWQDAMREHLAELGALEPSRLLETLSKI